jgi:hypothetical protein
VPSAPPIHAHHGTPASEAKDGTAPRATEIAARIRNPTPNEIAAVAKLSPT